MESEAATVDVIEPSGSLEMSALAAFAALGQPTRLSMLRLLVSHDPIGMTVSEIALAMQCPQNTASGHLAILSRAQLITGVRSGRSVIYRVDFGGVRWLVEYLLADCCNGDPAACEDFTCRLPRPGEADTGALGAEHQVKPIRTVSPIATTTPTEGSNQ